MNRNLAMVFNEVMKQGLVHDLRQWRWWKFTYTRIEGPDGSIDRAIGCWLPFRLSLSISLRKWGGR